MDWYLPVVAGLVIFGSVIAYVIIDKKKGWRHVKKTVGIEKDSEVKEDAGIVKTPRDIRLKFLTPDGGVIIPSGTRQKQGNKIDLMNREGLVVKEVNLGSCPLVNALQVITTGNTDELIFQIQDKTYIDNLREDKETMRMALDGRNEQDRRSASSAGQHFIEHAKLEGKINLNKYRGRRIMPQEDRNKRRSNMGAEPQEMPMEGE